MARPQVAADVAVEYISPDVSKQLKGDFQEFARVFEKFGRAEELTAEPVRARGAAPAGGGGGGAHPVRRPRR